MQIFHSAGLWANPSLCLLTKISEAVSASFVTMGEPHLRAPSHSENGPVLPYGPQGQKQEPAACRAAGSVPPYAGLKLWASCRTISLTFISLVMFPRSFSSSFMVI